jgi:hypothetical protein
MAILVDFSQIFIGAYMMSAKSGDVSMDVLRPTILNTLRIYRNKFHREYGELILCCDDKKSWRKNIFPNYKASRKKSRASALNITWNDLYESLSLMKAELAEWFPYKLLQVDEAEADDIIAVLVKTLGERALILSSDKDFIQLHQFNVVQYSPMQKKFVDGDAKWSLHEKLIKGDVGDGVPNILSDDSVLVDEGRRQRPIASKKLSEWFGIAPELFCTEEMLRNFNRNKQLIDLNDIPESICINISKQYRETIVGERKRLLTYFINHRLKNLTENLSEF